MSVLMMHVFEFHFMFSRHLVAFYQWHSDACRILSSRYLGVSSSRGNLCLAVLGRIPLRVPTYRRSDIGVVAEGRLLLHQLHL